MHTISQQSKFRKLKLKTGSESTVYTTYSEYPGGLYYPMPGFDPRGFSRSQSKFKPTLINIPAPPPPPPQPQAYGYR